MIARLAQIRSLSSAERLLLLEAVAMLAVASFLVALAPFRRVAALAGHPPRTLPNPAEKTRQIRAVSWAVRAAARRVPWRAKCIEQGFAAHWMLRRRAVRTIVHYGLARRDQGLVAHVWVRSGEAEVIGCENLADFTEVAQFPPPARPPEGSRLGG
jgi:hypothetical protein